MPAQQSRALVMQVGLGVALGGALLWKQQRERQSVPKAQRRIRAIDPAFDAAPYAGALPAPQPSLGERRPGRALGLALVALMALAPIALGVAYTTALKDTSPPVARATAAADVAHKPAVAAPITTRTPGLDEVLLDARRQLDLAQVRDSVNAYGLIFGAYPATNGELTTLCAQPHDAGCAIAKASTGLPVGDGELSYWYASDGATYTLLARVQTAPAQDDCPSKLPLGIGNAPVFCLKGSLGGR